jgi:hypothetical protein
MRGPTGFSVADGATVKTSKTNGPHQGTLTLALPMFLNARRRALDTIDDLGLNKLDVRYYRLYRAREFLADLLSSPVSERQALYDSYAAGEYAGTTRMVVEQLRQGGHI